MVRVYYQLPVTIDRASVEALRQKIDEILSPLNDQERFKQDISYLRSRGVTQNTLIGILKVSKRSFLYWKKGEVTPRSPCHFLLIREFARRLREKEKAQREAGLKAQVTVKSP